MTNLPPITQHHLLSESASLVLDYDLVDNVLDARWTAAQTLATTRAGYEQILAELPALHCHRLLDDRRNSRLMWNELAEWMTTDWYPGRTGRGCATTPWFLQTTFLGTAPRRLFWPGLTMASW